MYAARVFGPLFDVDDRISHGGYMFGYILKNFLQNSKFLSTKRGRFFCKNYTILLIFAIFPATTDRKFLSLQENPGFVTGFVT
jgi:hypothetical protein